MQRSNNQIGSRSGQPARLGDNLDPALRTWVDNCIVPILVKDYLASLQVAKELAPAAEPMAQFSGMGSSSGEVKQ